jgi:uncharacterized repeat protein (TIGR03803 family)
VKRLVLAVIALGLAAANALAQTDGANAGSVTFTTLHSFKQTDGQNPWGQLVQAIDGDLYGTTSAGGANGAGTVFKIGPGGKLTTVYNFCSQSDCTDGAHPLAGLVQTVNGDLYGTTSAGGISNTLCPYRTCGTIFKITPGGTLTTTFTFCSQASCADGQTPVGGLVPAANGDLYGTTSQGGTNNVVSYGGGTLFKIAPSGTLTTLHAFCAQAGCPDGEYPSATMIQAKDGNLYGTAGGISPGTIFKITPAGKFTPLYTFCSQNGCTDGNVPTGPLVQAANGNLYGTTLYGGVQNAATPSGSGTIFEITPSGQLTTIYAFCAQSGCPDGALPNSGLIQASDGNFYGTTEYGGASMNPTLPTGGGTIFQLSPSDTLITLYSFCAQAGCPDGVTPFGPLVQDTLGVLYGTTLDGGADGNQGTVFSVSTGAPSFVITRPTVAVVGEVVTILGYGLNGATSVTFNGTPATILYDAPTVIYAKVPAGATTGKVQVVTPSGTLTSNVAFEVAP